MIGKEKTDESTSLKSQPGVRKMRIYNNAEIVNIQQYARQLNIELII